MAEGLARSGFDQDLLDGKAVEDAFARILLRARVEVKCDQIARRTGNVFIEREQAGRRDGIWRPSGLDVTIADWWATEVNPDCFVLVTVERLRAVVQRVLDRDPSAAIVGGDFNRYRGVLVPLDGLLRWHIPARELRLSRDAQHHVTVYPDEAQP